MLNNLLRAMGCCRKSVETSTNPDGYTLVWLVGENCPTCSDRSWCLELCVALEKRINMENSVQAIVGGEYGSTKV